MKENLIEWKTPTVDDISEMRDIIGRSGMQGSDCCAANIFLLREKYNIKIAIIDGTLLRLYTGTRLPGRGGMAFPIGSDPMKALEILISDCKSVNKPVRFVFLTAEQKDMLSSRYPDMSFDTYEGNYDYMYTSAHLWELTGNKNAKKRNRVKHFCREYPEWEIKYFDGNDQGPFLEDMIKVEERWFSSLQERVDSSFVERLEIYEACKYWKELGFYGAILYVGSEPAAMTIASEISPGNIDIVFEKCYGSYAQAGGFSVINKYFAGYLAEQHGAKWINREEDIGLEGLRRAKMAYHPDKMLIKYHTVKPVSQSQPGKTN